jgi:hypothetical protein
MELDDLDRRALAGIVRAWLDYGLVYGAWRLGFVSLWVETVVWWIVVIVTGIYAVTFLACEAIVACHSWRH